MNKKQFLKTLFIRFNESGIRYFVFGSYQSLPESTGGSDIDMIIEECDCILAEKVLKDIINCSEIVLASYYTNSSTRFYRFLTKSWGVQIDIYYKGLCYRGVPYFPVDRLRNNLIMHNGIVRVLEESRGFYLDYFKEVVHNGKVKEKYVLALMAAMAENAPACLDEIRNVYGKKAAQIIAENRSFWGLQDIAKPLQKITHKQLFKGQRLTVLKDRIQSFLRLFSKRPGYVIVVEGTDGSGKSTIINHITPILNECFHKYVFYNHLRPKLIPDLGVVMGKKPADEAEHVNSDPHGQSQSGFLGSLIRWGYYMIDYTFGYLNKVWIQIHSKSKVFIFDRYYYDYYIDQKRSRTNLPNWIIRFGEMLIAKPDLILCLGGDPEKIYARKPETSLKEVERQTNVLKHFCETHQNAVWIDTTTTIEQSCEEAMNAIVTMMSKRFN